MPEGVAELICSPCAVQTRTTPVETTEEPLEDDEVDDPRAPVAAPVPRQPKEEERLKHNLTHMPFAAWCRYLSEDAGRTIRIVRSKMRKDHPSSN